ncbi:hypothetical protein C8T65DRAFT_268057 [Cerioporus squamosus]|nr:hypothetical protein C8T65DRAFT_268057 [Cerioporus squamosus]
MGKSWPIFSATCPASVVTAKRLLCLCLPPSLPLSRQLVLLLWHNPSFCFSTTVLAKVLRAAALFAQSLPAWPYDHRPTRGSLASMSMFAKSITAPGCSLCPVSLNLAVR